MSIGAMSIGAMTAGGYHRNGGSPLDFRSIGVLGLIVLIRTFLSFSLEVEIKGHWPWQESRIKMPGPRQPGP